MSQIYGDFCVWLEFWGLSQEVFLCVYTVLTKIIPLGGMVVLYIDILDIKVYIAVSIIALDHVYTNNKEASCNHPLSNSKGKIWACDHFLGT